ncbi:IclR family transcriptional regulator [Natronolimnohabitans innermongolicus]|uniref:ArcR family transcription regulator n=1 Tax=Natronolimnohabitans innermongolicus JCM 12255 TaxID=1227499 RepID=L9WRF4_9EURY|nr:IclR family transcriptional regulator [Natronolimnohabitans innermongolicus]ELY50903.1 ArcR family transcription regulator [Natronolimnohabitans innermongolicus JCM 12255]
MSDATPPMSSVLNAFDVLTVLWEVNGAGPSAVARRMDMPKSTAHVYLRTLEETGYVVNEDGEYRLSHQFLSTGSRIKHRNSLFQASEAKLRDLAMETGELVTLVIEEAGQSVILHKDTGDRSLELGIYSGMITPLHSNATGKAILANLPPERVDEILETQGLTALTSATITDEAQLRAELEVVRERGYAVDWDQQVQGMGLIGAPIEIDGRLEGAVGIAGPTGRIQDEAYQTELLQELRGTIDSITIKYRYGT